MTEHPLTVTGPLEMPGNHCEVHGYHWPPPHRTVTHHIMPQEFGGLTVPDNLIKVCDNGHYNIHEILNAMIWGKTPPKGTRKENRLAIAGFEQIKKAGKL